MEYQSHSSAWVAFNRKEIKLGDHISINGTIHEILKRDDEQFPYYMEEKIK